MKNVMKRQPIVRQGETDIPNRTYESTAIPSPGSSSGDDLRGKGILLGIILLLLAGAGFFVMLGYRVIQIGEDTRESIEGLASTSAVSDMAVERVSVQEPATSPEESQPTNDAIDKSTLEISVLNGGGPKGSATAVADLLKSDGYIKTTAGNSSGDYSGFVVYRKAGSEEAADAVMKTLSVKYPSVIVKENDAGKSEVSSAPIVVIIGR